ncbi:MAG: FkbM family methyltransferase [Thermomonas sp.]|uniref:FkbM family methyltransferase n=1 Tax=Thermomonas sp. TaxID=1971895 RepID=UPI0039E6F931
MNLPNSLQNSRLLRAPLLAVTKACLQPLTARLPLLRRAAYDVEPMPYLVVGDREKYVVSTQDKVIGRELFLHGEFDFQKLVIALEILRREGRPTPRHLIDVGANIGSIVIPALTRGLMQTGTAIEPHPENLRLLRANLALNGVEDRVRVLAQAVGEEATATLFLQESMTNSGNHSVADAGLPTPSTRLDDVESPRPDALLWMDIEGYEGHALQGATQLLASGMPVVCEFNPLYLHQTGGFHSLCNALAGRLIFDLNDQYCKCTSLEILSEKYPGGDLFTDILAISHESIQ